MFLKLIIICIGEFKIIFHCIDFLYFKFKTQMKLYLNSSLNSYNKT